MTITLGLPHKFSYNHPRKSVGLLAEFIPIYWASMLVIKAELQQTISHKYPFIYMDKMGMFLNAMFGDPIGDGNYCNNPANTPCYPIIVPLLCL